VNAQTQEIPRENWLNFFNDVSKLYQGWQVTVELLGQDLGDQPEVTDLPLQGLSYETAGSEANDILVEAGDLPMGYITHHVNNPRAVRAVAAVPGVETDIEIEGEDGYRTLVRLRQRPELPGPGQATARPN
jgi:CheY-like chemotaxis protein